MSNYEMPEPNRFVGAHFVAACSCNIGKHVYYCDSYDPRLGYWMTRADCPPEHKADEYSEWRRNVSERAINRTFHLVYTEGDRAWSNGGIVNPDLLTVP